VPRCAESDKLFSEACEKFRKVAEIKPNLPENYYNWGSTLFEWARRKETTESDKLFGEACEKFKKGIEIKPDKDAYKLYGNALLNWANKKSGVERKKLLGEAIIELQKTEELSRGAAAYNLGCAYCFLGDEEECRKWLKIGEEAGTLPTRDYAMGDEDLKLYWGKEWFKAIRWGGEK
jgi:tetratricopeptide (TPR) repeat protein